MESWSPRIYPWQLLRLWHLCRSEFSLSDLSNYWATIFISKSDALVAVKNILTKATGGRGRVDDSLRLSWQGSYGGGSLRQLLILHLHLRSREWCSAHFLIFIQSGASAHGVVPPTLRVGLICSVKTFIAAPSQGVFPWWFSISNWQWRLTIAVVMFVFCTGVREGGRVFVLLSLHTLLMWLLSSPLPHLYHEDHVVVRCYKQGLSVASRWCYMLRN